MDDLAEENPELVTVINAGLSYEGRQIKYVRISTTRFENPRKPVIVIDAMVHAREWVTTPVAIYIIEQLVKEAANSALADGIDWIIIPLANPDGYEYSIDEVSHYKSSIASLSNQIPTFLNIAVKKLRMD